MRRKREHGPAKWRVTIGAFFGIVLLILGLSILRLYSVRTWDDVLRFTILVRDTGSLGSQFRFESFDPVTGEAIRVAIPDDLAIVTLQGRGEWRVGVLPDLANRFGWKWVSDSISDSLGLGSAGFKSDLVLWDQVEWWWKTRQVQFRNVNLSETALLEKTDAIDGEKVLGLSTVWDDKAREWFVSAGLVQEGKTVKIVNSVGETGMGTHAARLIEHSGLRVGTIENDQSRQVEECEIRSGVYGHTVKFLERSFGCDFIEIGDDSSVSLVLGTKYRQRWLGK